MSEAYCSFEVARLLKEKGFGEFIPFGWNLTEKYPDLRNFIEDTGRGGYHDKKGDWLSCPTHQMAMKWLREVHGIFIQISAVLQDQPLGLHYRPSIQDYHAYARHDNFSEYITYEDAVEAALKYSLENLIK